MQHQQNKNNTSNINKTTTATTLATSTKQHQQHLHHQPKKLIFDIEGPECKAVGGTQQNNHKTKDHTIRQLLNPFLFANPIDVLRLY